MARRRGKKAISVFIGQRIRHLRKRRGLTQEHLAELISKTSQTLGGYERGEISADVATLQDIARAVDGSIFDLIEPVTGFGEGQQATYLFGSSNVTIAVKQAFAALRTAIDETEKRIERAVG
jgi:transcriptional regulator with XRE-family HTH domain